MEQDRRTDHFKGKNALEHVVEAQARGLIASSEIHGTEIPGHWGAGADSARETAVILLMLWAIFQHFELEPLQVSAVFLAGLLVWKLTRASWLGWSRLERLHRVMAEEKWEIENHREQERGELRELYRAKGFEGKLLEDVLDVLMADGDRLLRVMLEEELGLSLEVHEHPLKQGIGAAFGVLVAGAVCWSGMNFAPPAGILTAATVTIGVSTYISARFQQNRPTPAVVWNVGMAALSFATVYFLLEL